MRIGKILLLIFALLVLTELFLVFRPEPPILTAGVGLGTVPINDMLRKRFPIGSPASDLENELAKEGYYWGSIQSYRIGRSDRFSHYVIFRRWVSFFIPERTSIEWQVDDAGRLTDVQGSKFLDINVP